ncbi:MAG: RluA family pseudouridine synthase [Bacteroidetes bacterium]|nr:RluA family pseudouridine synthase [Bacteroidota bacterium]MCL5025081.1 RluA family pseudouridine synthase [Chloroflexota bacterium]
MQRRTIVVSAQDTGQRLDRALARAFPELSRTRLQQLIAVGAVTLDGAPAEASRRLHPGERIEVSLPAPQPSDLTPEQIPVSIVYEDDDLLVIDKPPGLVVHPGAGHPSGTLVNALLARHPSLAIGGSLRPGIVHRLDRDTSGLMVVAKTDRAMASLTSQMRARQVLKEYTALVWGRPDSDRGVIEAPIGREHHDRRRMAVVEQGRPARTHFEVIETIPLHGTEEVSLLRVRLETGRTHQVRVHLAAIGHPVVGDPEYGRRGDTIPLKRQFLHASRLGFKLPGGEYCEFRSPLPADLAELLAPLRRAQF